MSITTKSLLKELDRAHKKASETNLDDIDDWGVFKGIQNWVNNMLKSEKKNCRSENLRKASGDVSKTWTTVKSWLGWSSGGPPVKLSEKGILSSKVHE